MRLVKPSAEDRETPRGVVGGSEISQATTGATNIFMGRFRVPPGAQSRPHYHEDCESALYMLSRQHRDPVGRPPGGSPDGRAGRHALRAAAPDAHRRATGRETSRRSTWSRATRPRRTPSRSGRGLAKGERAAGVVGAGARGEERGSSASLVERGPRAGRIATGRIRCGAHSIDSVRARFSRPARAAARCGSPGGGASRTIRPARGRERVGADRVPGAVEGGADAVGVRGWRAPGGRGRRRRRGLRALEASRGAAAARRR